MSQIEKYIIRRRLWAWINGHGLGEKKADENWGTTESNIAEEMFEAGWIAGRIETEDDQIIKD